MKGHLVFKLPEEQDEFMDAQKGIEYRMALEEIADQVFRPARKYGYSDQELKKLLDSHPESIELIAKLEHLFFEILNQRDIKLF